MGNGNLQILLNVICVKFQLCNGNNGCSFELKNNVCKSILGKFAMPMLQIGLLGASL
jgi:hypothetical protein